MTPARKACAHPGCPHLQPCPNHQPDPWARTGPTRRELTGTSGWAEGRQRTTVLYRDEGICHICGRPGADQVDHVTPLSEGGADTLDNKRAIHAEPCHHEKTAAEAARARNPTT